MKKSYLIVMFLIACLGGAAVFTSTPYGAGIYSDSVMYILIARSVLHGNGWTIDGSAITTYPPLYPLLLSFSGLFGSDPVRGARILQVILFGANIFWIGMLALRCTNGSRWTAFLASIVMLGAVDMLGYHSIILSDGAFLFFCLPALLSLSLYIEHRTTASLITSAAFTSLAALTRYAGFAWISAGVIAIFLLQREDLKNRLQACFIFAAVSFLPSGIWLLRNIRFHSATGRTFAAHGFFGSPELASLLRTISQWFLQGVVPAARWMLILPPIFLFLLVYWKRSIKRLNAQFANDRIQLLTIFICSYILFIIASAAFFQADLLRDSTRILLPLHALVLLAVTSTGHSWFNAVVTGTMHRSTQGFLICFTAFILITTIGHIDRFSRDGQGYAARVYKESRLFEKINAMPQDYSIYSNADLPITLYTGRSPDFLPAKIDNQTQQPNKHYEDQMKRMVNDLRDGGGAIVYFNHDDHWFELPGIEEINRWLPLRCVDKEEDGAIYEAVQDTLDNEDQNP